MAAWRFAPRAALTPLQVALAHRQRRPLRLHVTRHARGSLAGPTAAFVLIARGVAPQSGQLAPVSSRRAHADSADLAYRLLP